MADDIGAVIRNAGGAKSSSIDDVIRNMQDLELKRDKTATWQPNDKMTNFLDLMNFVKNESNKKEYNLDYDEDVDAFKRLLSMKLELGNAFDSLLSNLDKIVESGEASADAIMFNDALKNALKKEDTIGLRAAGRGAQDGYDALLSRYKKRY